jgi:hypothetical protein
MPCDQAPSMPPNEQRMFARFDVFGDEDRCWNRHPIDGLVVNIDDIKSGELC